MRQPTVRVIQVVSDHGLYFLDYLGLLNLYWTIREASKSVEGWSPSSLTLELELGLKYTSEDIFPATVWKRWVNGWYYTSLTATSIGAQNNCQQVRPLPEVSISVSSQRQWRGSRRMVDRQQWRYAGGRRRVMVAFFKFINFLNFLLKLR